MDVQLVRSAVARYIVVDVAVRYGDEDMPFDAPMRDGDSWRATIDLDTHTVENWPQGRALAFVDMKVCDEGLYKILDADRNVLAIRDGYVPNRLLPGDYGDYLSLDIDKTGRITNWLPNAGLANFEFGPRQS